MLKNLYIKNYAIIDEINIEFGRGFNVLTGETGAGKSIIINALNIGLGARAQPDYIVHHDKQVEIRMTLDTTENTPLKQSLGECHLMKSGSGHLNIERMISPSGRNKCSVNGNCINLSTLRNLANTLVDFHGQYDHQCLFDSLYQLEILDAFAGAKPQRTEYENLFIQCSNKLKEWMELSTLNSEKDKEIDYLSFQLNEIDTAHLSPGEEERLEDRIRLLQNAEEIATLIDECCYILENAEDNSVFTHLGKYCKNMDKLTHYIPKEMESCLADTQQAIYLLEETARKIKYLKEHYTFDVKEIDSLQERLFQIKTLKKKYGKSVEEIIDYAKKLEHRIEQMETIDTQLHTLEKKISAIYQKIVALGQSLYVLRSQAAENICQKIEHTLIKLGIDLAKIKFDIKPVSFGKTTDIPSLLNIFLKEQTSLKKWGVDEVNILFSANKDHALKPLAKTASGGEISRVMLSIKTVLADIGPVSTLVFDEIDTGISGKVAKHMGKLLQSLSKHRQIICITHLPQIAVLADTHFSVRKNFNNNTTHVAVQKLDPEARKKELRNLLGDENVAGVTIPKQGKGENILVSDQ